MGNHSRIPRSAVIIACIAMVIALLSGCGSNSSKNDDSVVDSDAISSEPSESTEESTEAESQENAVIPEVTDAIDIDSVDVPYGTLMASDGEYHYFSFVSNKDEGGLYRTDHSFSSAVMLDRGIFTDLYLLDGKLYYAEREHELNSTNKPGPELTYFCLDTDDLSVSEISFEDFEAARVEVDPAARFDLPEDVLYCAVVEDRAYFIQKLGELEESSSGVADTTPNYALSYCDEQGNVTQTDITWRHRGQLGLILPYGDYVVYSRNCMAATHPDADAWTREESCGEVPCFYNTKTGEETAIVREHDSVGNIMVDGFGHVIVIGASSDCMLASSNDDEYESGEYVELESISNPGETILLESVIEGAEITDDLEQRDAAEREAELEELRNEPYGPGTSSIYLTAPQTRSACYRLVRMDGSTEFQVLLEPGESITESFPCGRYTLKTAEGEEWISDEEAFGPNGDYDTTDVFSFEDGESYQIGSGYNGDFKNDSASGFVGN